MPIGTSWASGSWEDDAWADGSWADAGVVDTSTYPPIFTFELAPGLPITASYQTIELPASRQMISLDSLPLGTALTTQIPSDIIWETLDTLTWESGVDIEWENTILTPSSIDLKG